MDETTILGDVLAAHLAEGAAEASQLQPYRAVGVQQLHILMLRAHSPVKYPCMLTMLYRTVTLTAIQAISS